MVGIKPIEMQSIEEVVNDSETMRIPEGRRNFQYNMNDKAAKAKLIKGAKREAFDIVRNQTSCNLIFSTGSWNHLVLPTIQYWTGVNGNKTCKIQDMEIRIVRVKSGRDIIGKHIDTQVIFFINREKAVSSL